jgi:hypothetical protein
MSWIGLRENLQETRVLTIKYSGFLKIFTSSNSMNECHGNGFGMGWMGFSIGMSYGISL